jgi:hypothetical protein
VVHQRPQQQRCRRDDEAGLRREQDLAAIEPVDHRTADDRCQHEGHELHESDQTDLRRRLGQRKDLNEDRNDRDLGACLRDQLGPPDAAIVR